MSINLRIGIIGLIVVLLGILNFKAELFWSMGYGDYPDAFYFGIRPFNVRVPFVRYPLDIICCAVLMVASVLYMTKDKGLKVIAFLFSLIFAQRVGSIVLFVTQFITSPPSARGSAINLIVPVLLVAASCYVLYLFQQEWDKRAATMEKTEASKSQRFLGYGIDVLVIAIMVFPRFDWTELPFYERLFMMVIIYVFYISFERPFRFTPGKIIMNTRVTNENGDAPEETSVFTRNLCRFIPFEAFSFFGKKGWHDSISKTSVYHHQ